MNSPRSPRKGKYLPVSKGGLESPITSEAVCDDLASDTSSQQETQSLPDPLAQSTIFAIQESKLPPGMPSKYPYPTELKFSPPISLNSKDLPTSEGDHLVAPKIIKVKYFYPLKKELIIEYEQLDDLSYFAFSTLIQKEYQRLYSEEADSFKAQPLQRVANPYKSTYGIWGPGLEEMFLTGIKVESFDEIGIPIYQPEIEDLI